MVMYDTYGLMSELSGVGPNKLFVDIMIILYVFVNVFLFASKLMVLNIYCAVNKVEIIIVNLRLQSL